MTWRFIPLMAAVCLWPNISALAQETEVIGLGDGSSITIDEYLIERSEEDTATVVVMAKPNFDPEPFGAVPSDDFARRVQPLCAGLVQNSRETLEAENARSVRIRWDFKPTYDTGSPEWMEMSRFHEFLFVLDENWMCIPQPLGVGLDNLEPDLPSGLPVSLRYIEPGPRARQLTLTYDVGEDLAAVTNEKLENAAIELCILHADPVLDDRRQYYQHLETALVAIAFAQNDGRGQEFERRVLFGVKEDACNTGLSSTLADAIRGMGPAETAPFVERPAQ
ncbi:MAG: hypothetical protein ABS76_07855 [Pelagibacterium sp. SCN 64-44]|nr:MAG: hypothetical protein ABS76_07855 [Pelagibacterium sp. SCN 64-44]